jgi:hypothetical protein
MDKDNETDQWIKIMADNENTGSLNIRELRLPMQQSHLPGFHHLL